MKKPSLFELFISFAKIGAMTFGGGYAMIPMLEKECVIKHKWIGEDELLNFFAVAQCTPGVIAVNTATFIGYKKRGVIGGIVATLGVTAPSLVIIISIANFLLFFNNNVYFDKIFSGIRVSVCALIAKSLVDIAKKSIKNFMQVAVALISFLLPVFINISPALIVVIVGVFSLIYVRCKRLKHNDLS